MCESKNEMRVKHMLGFLTFCFSLISLMVNGLDYLQDPRPNALMYLKGLFTGCPIYLQGWPNLILYYIYNIII